MNHVRNLVKIILLVQCCLFCVCTKEAVLTTEENRLNLADFVKCPFNEKIEKNTDFVKYFLKKFGKPDEFKRGQVYPGDNSGLIAVEETLLEYDEKYRFIIHSCTRDLEEYTKEFRKRINKKFKVIREISIYSISDADLKYGLNTETTIKDIERLFGKPDWSHGDTTYVYSYDACDSTYCSALERIEMFYYRLYLEFKKGKLIKIKIETKFL
ncbi:MAG: hypothetical protein FWF73_02030 [Spirochaetes bacterium]|nr:hypothetical protein [Spirochaetota bacterium]